jgi:hypothetical protein
MLVDALPRARLVRSGPTGLKIRDLLDRAKESLFRELIERRSKVRYPFFCPATLEWDGERPGRFSMFTRDLSRSGVGLLHAMELPLRTGRLIITPDEGDKVERAVEIAWCEPVGEGWYISGATFLEMID